MSQQRLEDIAHVGWDRGLDWNQEKDRLLELVRTTHNRRDKAFYTIAFVTVLNGSRIGETITALLSWAENGKREQRVRVQKRKDRYMRLIIIPDSVRQYKQLREEYPEMQKEYHNLANVAEHWIKHRLRYNVHALRFAWITAMANHMHPQEIARITGHKKLELILLYTQRQGAEHKHRELVK